MTRILRVFAMSLIAGSLLAMPAAAGAEPKDEPGAVAAGRCKVPNGGRGLGPTYVTALSVSRTSCATGVKLVKAFCKCRVKNGGRRGYCRSRVLGYKCSERRTNSIRTQYDSSVKCSRGSARINHSYTQFT